MNPALPPEAITAAVDELTRDRSAMSLAVASREVYLLLKEGIKVSVPDMGTDSTPHPSPLPVRGGEGVKSGGQKTERVRVIDWEHPTNPAVAGLVSQFSIAGALGSLIDKLREVLRRGVLAGDKGARSEPDWPMELPLNRP